MVGDSDTTELWWWRWTKKIEERRYVDLHQSKISFSSTHKSQIY